MRTASAWMTMPRRIPRQVQSQRTAQAIASAGGRNTRQSAPGGAGPAGGGQVGVLGQRLEHGPFTTGQMGREWASDEP